MLSHTDRTHTHRHTHTTPCPLDERQRREEGEAEGRESRMRELRTASEGGRTGKNVDRVGAAASKQLMCICWGALTPLMFAESLLSSQLSALLVVLSQMSSPACIHLFLLLRHFESLFLSFGSCPTDSRRSCRCEKQALSTFGGTASRCSRPCRVFWTRGLQTSRSQTSGDFQARNDNGGRILMRSGLTLPFVVTNKVNMPSVTSSSAPRERSPDGARS